MGLLLKFFQTRYPDIPVTTILLAGYAGAIPQFGDYIGGKTGVASRVADPWQKVSVPTGDQKLAAVATEFATAVGLAQRRNLL